MSPRRPSFRRPLGAAAVAATLLAPGPLAAQWEVGIGMGVADTRQNAVALAGTITWNPAWSVPIPVGGGGGPVRFALRGFTDAELAVPDFKAGLGYEEPDREWIVETVSGVRQRPEGDELWQARGFDAHFALYATAGWWRIWGGFGGAYNGLDGTTDWAAVAIVYVTNSTEVDVEVLPGLAPEALRWRLRLSIGFWRFP